MANSAPVVTAINLNIDINSVIDAANLFTVFDPDGDGITRLRFMDFDDEIESGSFALSGIPYANGSQFEINFSQLSNLTYFAASEVRKEFIRIQAFDGTSWSDPMVLADTRTVAENLTKPVGDPLDFNIVGNEILDLSTVINAYDPDGWAIQLYYVRDRVVDGNFLTYGAQTFNEGQYYYVTADNLDRLRFNSVHGGTDYIDFFAYDGGAGGNGWSARATSEATITDNQNRPIVQFNSVLIPYGDEIGVYSNVLWTDADPSTAKSISVYDRTSHTWSGDLLYNGVPLAAKQWHTFDISQVNNLSYRAGERTFNEQVLVKVNDGKFTSAAGTLLFENVPRSEVASERVIFGDHLTRIDVVDVLDQLDDGPPPVSYDLIDLTNNGGRFELNGFAQPSNQMISVTASQMNNDLEWRFGGYLERGADNVMVRANNSDFEGQWTFIEFMTEPMMSTSMDSGSFWRDNLSTVTADGVEISYSYMIVDPAYDAQGEAEDHWGTYGVWDPAAMEFVPDGDGRFKPNQRAATRLGFDRLSEIANITFVEVDDNSINEFGYQGGIMRLGNYWNPDGSAAAYAWLPGHKALAEFEQFGHSWYNGAFMDPDDWSLGSPSYTTHMHEIGHAMGFTHPFDNGSFILPPDTDNDKFTVMSYTGREDGINPMSYQIYDIYMYQREYGANMNTRTGDDLYTAASMGEGNPQFAVAIWDAGGEDTLSAQGLGSDAVIDLRQGRHSSIGAVDNVGLAYGVTLEHGIGGFADDQLIGNSSDNNLSGGNGQDVLWGGGGNDMLMGGAGNDMYYFGVGDNNDTIMEGEAGRDSITIATGGATNLSFPGLDDFRDDLTFFRTGLGGRDLVMDLTIDGGPSQGRLIIEEQAWGSYRIETINLGAEQIDLTSVYAQTTTFGQQFRPIADSSIFGNLVVPV